LSRIEDRSSAIAVCRVNALHGDSAVALVSDGGGPAGNKVIVCDGNPAQWFARRFPFRLGEWGTGFALILKWG
jgi:hypothetical protein